jgi:5-methylcytosine-specific restriction endonuclease McrA
MRTYVLSHLSDAVLLRDLEALVAQERTATAAVLAHIAEVDARRLYLPAGFPSMHAYCVGALRLSEDAAYKRIQAARAARQFPALFTAVAEGRLHLTGLGLLVPHLTAENAGELLAAATYKTKSEIEELLAQRFPRTEWLALVQAIPASPSLRNGQLAPAQVEAEGAGRVGTFADQLAPAQVETPVPRPRVKPLAPGRFALQLTIGQDTHDKLRYAQVLLSHRLPSGDLAQLFDLALDALLRQLEKQKLAATSRPQRRSRRSSGNPRHIPARVKRAVWERDRGRCTYVSAPGQRCPERRFLQFDHIDPVARGGQATVAGVRLLCRAHNQYEAERTFGAGFMSEKREQARRAAAEARTRAAAAGTRGRAAAAESRARAREAEAEARTRAAAATAEARAQAREAEAEARGRAAAAEARSRAVAKEQAREVTTCLRELGFRAGEARRAVECCETLPDATLEERVRAALKFLCPKARFHGRDEASLQART